MLKDTLKVIVESQKKELELQEVGVNREIAQDLDFKSSHALIISGIRRCGKSTLLRQLMKKKDCYYLNFEDPRLVNFNLSDFEKLDEIFIELQGKSNKYFFDEIQNVPEWERFVRQKQDSGKKFVITGSNASLLSKELGTKLTGRHLITELFPFSYTEMLFLNKTKPSLETFQHYLELGGFPEYLQTKNKEILRHAFTDILNRDIVMRHLLKDQNSIKELAIFLTSNVGKEFSFNSLRKLFNMGSTNTAVAYVSHLEDSYLLFTVPRFSSSYKKQIANPKKVYSIDTGFASSNSASFSEDKGRMLENAVFLGLRRKHKNIFYFREKHECDFLVKERGKIVEAIQVCYKLDEDNKEREISGLKEAMDSLKISEGIIITLDQRDTLDKIKVIPVWEWLAESR